MYNGIKVENIFDTLRDKRISKRFRNAPYEDQFYRNKVKKIDSNSTTPLFTSTIDYENSRQLFLSRVLSYHKTNIVSSAKFKFRSYRKRRWLILKDGIDFYKTVRAKEREKGSV
jgi:hypothetical protein